MGVVLLTLFLGKGEVGSCRPLGSLYDTVIDRLEDGVCFEEARGWARPRCRSDQ